MRPPSGGGKSSCCFFAAAKSRGGDPDAAAGRPARRELERVAQQERRDRGSGRRRRPGSRRGRGNSVRDSVPLLLPPPLRGKQPPGRGEVRGDDLHREEGALASEVSRRGEDFGTGRRRRRWNRRKSCRLPLFSLRRLFGPRRRRRQRRRQQRLCRRRRRRRRCRLRRHFLRFPGSPLRPPPFDHVQLPIERALEPHDRDPQRDGQSRDRRR